MTNETASAVEPEGPPPELGDPAPVPPAYPDTPAGALMQQRDAYRARAVNARTLAEQYTAAAIENDSQADGLQAALDGLDA